MDRHCTQSSLLREVHINISMYSHQATFNDQNTPPMQITVGVIHQIPQGQSRQGAKDLPSRARHVTIKFLRRLRQSERRRYGYTAVVLATQRLQYPPRHLAGAPIRAAGIPGRKHRPRTIPANLPVLHVAELHLRRDPHCPKHERVPPRLHCLLRRRNLRNAPRRKIPINFRHRRDGCARRLA